MEATGASNEEAPPTNVRKKDLTKSQRLEAISILRVKYIDGRFERGAIVDIAKRFNVAHTTIWRLWQQAACMRVGGIINSPELVSLKKNSGRAPKYLPEFIEEGVKDVPLRKRRTQQKLVTSMGVSKTTVHRWIVASMICVHCNSLKPILTEENKQSRFEMALSFRNLGQYQDMRDRIHIDEKWLFLRGRRKDTCCIMVKRTQSALSSISHIL